MVARTVRDRKAASSNLATPTTRKPPAWAAFVKSSGSIDSVSLRCAGAPLTRCAALLYKARGSYKSRHSDHEKAAYVGGFSVGLRAAGEQFHLPAAYVGGFRKVKWLDRLCVVTLRKSSANTLRGLTIQGARQLQISPLRPRESRLCRRLFCDIANRRGAIPFFCRLCMWLFCGIANRRGAIPFFCRPYGRLFCGIANRRVAIPFTCRPYGRLFCGIASRRGAIPFFAARMSGFRKVEWALPRKTIVNGLTGTPEL